MKKILLTLTALLSLSPGAYAQSAWTQPNAHQYNDETVVYATLCINGHAVGADNGDYDMAAFIGNECRAVAEATTGANGQTLFVLRVGGDREADHGRSLRFEARYKTKGNTYPLSADVDIVFDSESWGRPSRPIVFSGDGYVPHTSVRGFDWSISSQPFNHETVQLQLIPHPADATFNIADLRFRCHADYDWNTVWKVVDIALASHSPIIYNVTFHMPIGADIHAYWADEPDGEVPLWPADEPEASESFCYLTAAFRLDLKEGWQWRSNPNGYLWGDDLANGFGPDLIEARTQDELLYNDPAWGYFGTMMDGNGIDDNMAYKVRMAADYRSRTFGMSLTTGDDCFELPVSEGWTWMPTPYLYNRLLRNIFQPEQLTEGMVIISKENGSAEWDGSQWQGDLEVLPTEQSFLFYMPEGKGFSLRYNPERRMPQGNETPPTPSRRNEVAQGAAIVGHEVARRFRDNLTMVATLPLLNNLADYQLRAYVGDELRGVGHAGDADRVFVTVHADGGECVSFRLADLCTGIEYAVDETVVVAQPRLGSLRQPVALHATGLTQGIADLPMESTATSPAQHYDLQGRSLLPSSHAKGLIIRRTANGSFRKVIQR